MNAYELADDLEGWCDDVLSNQNRKNVFKKHAKMLRQQADRIAELEKQTFFIADSEKQGEPVAWMLADKQNECIRSIMAVQHDFVPEGCVEIPLYTTPQTKPLSEKELYEVFDKCYPNNGDGDVVTLVDFARAIEERHGIK